MLFTFPSRYWFAIGLSGVFSLTGWSRRIRAEFLVLPTYFRLNDRYADRPPLKHEPGGRPGQGHYDNYGYIVTGNAVLFNGRLVPGARASSFKDMGWGYAADSYNVYYCGEVIQGASVRNFKVVKDGYAKNSYDVYYLGQKIHGIFIIK